MCNFASEVCFFKGLFDANEQPSLNFHRLSRNFHGKRCIGVCAQLERWDISFYTLYISAYTPGALNSKSLV